MIDDKPLRLSELQRKAVGLRCPKCECSDLRVKSTWQAGNVIRRQRVCRHCGWVMTTSEGA